MQFPESVHNVVAMATTRHPASVSDAVDAALAGIKNLDEYEDLVASLVRRAVQELVYLCRSQANAEQRRSAESSNAAAASRRKVRLEDCKELAAVCRASLYDYSLAGTSLGEMSRSKLEDTAANEESQAAGHLFNARLCRRLAPLVGEDQTVRNAVKPKRLEAIFADLRQGQNGEAA